MTSQELKRKREALGLTQQQLADHLGTTRVSIARYEAGMRRIPGMLASALEHLRPPSRRVEIPMAGLVAAGSPIEAVPQTELVDVPPSMVKGEGYFALRVKGESMRDQGILPGDLVVIQKQANARNGQTVVAVVNQEATIKTYVKKETHIELHPANETMKPIIVTPEDDIRIEGVLVGVIRHLS